jgi:spermidine/putrescine transport system substrate-binding protein
MRIKIVAGLAAAFGMAMSSLGQAADAGKLSIYCWSEYVPQGVVDAFTKETGIKVSVENYASNEEMLAKLGLAEGAYDLIQPSEYVIEQLKKDGKLEELDHANIPNLKNIAPEFRNLSFDEGSKFSVPWMAGTVGIVVNTSKVKTPVKGYEDVFNEQFKGKIVVLDDAREMVSWALATLGVPVNDINAETLAKAKPILEKWIPMVQVFDSDSPKTALANEDVVLGIVWNGEGAKLYSDDKKFQWVLPAQGAHLFVDSLAVPKGAKNKANAEKFIDFILRPEISKMISDDFPYLNPNLEARKLLSEDQLKNPASFPTAEELAKLEVFKALDDATAQAIDKLVTDLRSQ